MGIKKFIKTALGVFCVVGVGCVIVVGCSTCSLSRLRPADAKSIETVCEYGDGEEQGSYAIGEKERALLKDEFDGWLRAGFDGFDLSFVTYVPSLRVEGEFFTMPRFSLTWGLDSTLYVIDFGENIVTVSLGDPDEPLTQYARKPTEADRRFRQFLLQCMKDGRLVKSDADRQRREQ